MNEMKPWEYFTLKYNPDASGRYPTGHWYCYAEPGYDGVGLTPQDAMAECIIGMSKALIEINDT